VKILKRFLEDLPEAFFLSEDSEVKDSEVRVLLNLL
jgi:hypothetical protein